VSVASWLSSLPVPEPIPAAELDELRHDLDRAASDALAPWRDTIGRDALPLRVPKSRLAQLQQCERFTVAAHERPSDTPPSQAMLKGVALDQFVAHQLVAGRVREPLADLTSMLEAAGDWASLAALDELDVTESEELLGPLAAAVADAWAGIDPAWMPRVESRASLVLADDGCVCAGVVDVELGGPSTTRPGVVIEVKSGSVASQHPAEVYLYALLLALRDRSAPAVVARWYPGDEPAGLAVTMGVLEAAARRLVDGLATWAELVAGATPTESPGPWCAWCVDAPRCPSAATGGGSGTTRDTGASTDGTDGADGADAVEVDDGW
jgi:hypothetical protein